MTISSSKSAKVIQDPLLQYICCKIRDILTEQQLSQKEFADLLGIEYTSVHNYIHGKTQIKATTLFKIATVLKVPIQTFYDGFELPTKQKKAQPVRLVTIQE